MSSTLIHVGECVETMRLLPADSIDSIVCDPPYGLEFMGKEWDKLDGGGAGMTAVGIGERAIPWPSFGGDPHGGANPTCSTCGGRARGAKRCTCTEPAWRVKGDEHAANGRAASAQAQQAWHAAWCAEALRILKPGGYLLAFGGTRTYHRLACAVEDAGFEIRDSLIWNYGSGFPKSLNVGNGRGTALKPAFEPVVVARKPLAKGLTIAANVLRYGTGALNIDGCRVKGGGAVHAVQSDPGNRAGTVGTDLGFTRQDVDTFQAAQAASIERTNTLGRWPANVIFTHAPECVRVGERTVGSGELVPGDAVQRTSTMLPVGAGWNGNSLDNSKKNAPNSYGMETVAAYECAPGCPVAALDAQSGDTGGASRFFTVTEYGDDDDLPGVPFFYNAKASRSEREAGCGELPGKTAVEAVGRDPESAGAKNPRAGAGRGAGAVHEACALCGVAVGASERRGSEAKPCPESEDGKHVPEPRETGVVIRNIHPTVKPVAVMRWLVRIVTPPGGIVLDPFAGSGTTGVACVHEDFLFIGIEREAEYADIARARIAHATNNRRAS